jgi:hypothetical protein
MRVIPGSPDDSFFFHKLTGEGLDATPIGSCGTQTNLVMPFGAAALTDSELGLIHRWIESGAQCTSTGGEQPKKPGIASFTVDRRTPLAGESVSFLVVLEQAAPEGGQRVFIDMATTAMAAPRQVMVPAGQTMWKFDGFALRPTSRFTMTARMGDSTKDAVLRIGGLEVAEVLADPMGADDKLQWVKLHNRTTIPIDLNSNYQLKAGEGSYEFLSYNLSGTIPAGGCVVVGGPLQSPANAEPNYTQAADFVPDIPHGHAQAAGIGVFDRNAVPINGVPTPVDTMLIGPSNSAQLLGPDAEIASPYCSTPAQGTSALRTGALACTPAQMQPNTCL